MGNPIFKAFIHLNYKTGDMDITKRLAVSKNPWVIVIPIRIEVEIPEANPIIPLVKKVIIPEIKLKEAMIEEL